MYRSTGIGRGGLRLGIPDRGQNRRSFGPISRSGVVPSRRLPGVRAGMSLLNCVRLADLYLTLFFSDRLIHGPRRLTLSVAKTFGFLPSRLEHRRDWNCGVD